MKKFILAPLCSAFIIPGLGQVINQELKKGVFLLSAVFVLFVIAAALLFFIVKSLLSQPGTVHLSLSHILERVDLLLLLGAFGGIWIYSVVDAFLQGWRRERRRER
ncbi:MAG: hypothetical protein JW836_07610 [Deltaproteobacteria bacterium]|nr:hypothetical protein [Deltaproteobacteria bacterium]